jgi:hypothetical protein
LILHLSKIISDSIALDFQYPADTTQTNGRPLKNKEYTLSGSFKGSSGYGSQVVDCISQAAKGKPVIEV